MLERTRLVLEDLGVGSRTRAFALDRVTPGNEGSEDTWLTLMFVYLFRHNYKVVLFLC